MWNWTRNISWMMWLGLVDDVEGSQWVVGREHKRAFQPRKYSSSLDCIFRIVSELSPSFKPLSGVDLCFTLLETAVYLRADKNLGCMDHNSF